MISIYLQLKRLQRVQGVQSDPKNNTSRTCAAYGIQDIFDILATPAGEDIAMESYAGRAELQPPTLAVVPVGSNSPAVWTP